MHGTARPPHHPTDAPTDTPADARTAGAPVAGARRGGAVRFGVLTLAVAALGATALTGCGPDRARQHMALSAPPAATEPADRPALRSFYQQKPAWSACGDLQCATLTVPMDYDHPQDGKTFTLPLVRAAATDPGRRIGSLVLNPGGPGGSGVETVKSGGADSFGKQARAHFDLVGFDPRGVAGSRPAVDCTPPDSAPDRAPDGASDQAADGTDATASPLYPRTDAERRAALAEAERTTADCVARSGDLLPHVGTMDAARDIDVLRAALGDDKLTYLGWSYGTWLGTAYAEQFPHRVRALVLDGAVDPALDWSQRALTGGRAFRKAVDDYADNCAKVVKRGCPANTPDGIRRLVADLYAKVARHPLRIKGSTDRLDENTLHSAIVLSMYTPEAQWQDLSDGLTAAAKGDGGKLAAVAGATATQGDDSSDAAPDDRPRDNSSDILTAVNCLDVPHPVDPQAYWEVLDRAHQESGVFGSSGVLAELNCRTWPAGPTRPHRVEADGVPPVLVIGTTGDAATPYEDAKSLASQLPGGMLLTYRGLGHTAYGRGSACVTDAVDDYLVRLTPLPAGTTC
ncbi:proteinase [Kitasatospora xanthocidica]|uniref:alpha/beta hydrolase n=1 Tax=Kitasatospora xanthocidica TaxID=83382 RepID=UPI0019CF34D1|nr:alpha/beta hydrolase [Kitasatospora xanthocidica]GHF71519.1 proteinase [Kitasatospora xanthocidica]